VTGPEIDDLGRDLGRELPAGSGQRRWRRPMEEAKIRANLAAVGLHGRTSEKAA
jgi:hypothetical protein